MNAYSILFFVEPESDIPQPQNSVLVKPLVFNEGHLLSVIKFVVLLYNHLESLPLYLKLCPQHLLSFCCLVIAIQVLRVEHHVFRLFHFFNFDIEQLINKFVLNFFLIPSISFSSQLLLYQSLEKLMKFLFKRSFQQVHFNNSINLAHKTAIVVDNVNCPTDGFFITEELINYNFIQRLLDSCHTHISHNCSTSKLCMLEQLLVPLSLVLYLVSLIQAPISIFLKFTFCALYFQLTYFISLLLHCSNQTGEHHKWNCLCLRVSIAKWFSTCCPSHAGFHQLFGDFPVLFADV